MNDSHLRSFIKGISWRFTASIDTFIIAFFITGRFEIALKIGVLEIFTKILLYYCHERVWHKIQWGKIASELPDPSK